MSHPVAGLSIDGCLYAQTRTARRTQQKKNASAPELIVFLGPYVTSSARDVVGKYRDIGKFVCIVYIYIRTWYDQGSKFKLTGLPYIRNNR